jgi:hypothetical protein
MAILQHDSSSYVPKGLCRAATTKTVRGASESLCVASACRDKGKPGAGDDKAGEEPGGAVGNAKFLP